MANIDDIIPNELFEITKENNLLENMKLIVMTLGSTVSASTKKYYRRIIDRVSHLTTPEDIEYELYITVSILNFFINLREIQPAFFMDIDIINLNSIFFKYIEKILKINSHDNDTYKKRKEELLVLIFRKFKDEFYYRKNERLHPKAPDLPFY